MSESFWVPMVAVDPANAMPYAMALVFFGGTAPGASARMVQLEVIRLRVVAEFRAAVVSGWGVGVLHPDETTVPVAAFRHALNVIVFSMAVQMSYDVPSELERAFTRSDIWLRGLSSGTVKLGAQASDAEPTPTYEVPEVSVVNA